MPAIARLGYLGFEVSDLGAWEHFALEVLGLGLAERGADGSLALRMDELAQRILSIRARPTIWPIWDSRSRTSTRCVGSRRPYPFPASR